MLAHSPSINILKCLRMYWTWTCHDQWSMKPRPLSRFRLRSYSGLGISAGLILYQSPTDLLWYTKYTSSTAKAGSNKTLLFGSGHVCVKTPVTAGLTSSIHSDSFVSGIVGLLSMNLHVQTFVHTGIEMCHNRHPSHSAVSKYVYRYVLCMCVSVSARA